MSYVLTLNSHSSPLWINFSDSMRSLIDRCQLFYVMTVELRVIDWRQLLVLLPEVLKTFSLKGKSELWVAQSNTNPYVSVTSNSCYLQTHNKWVVVYCSWQRDVTLENDFPYDLKAMIKLHITFSSVGTNQYFPFNCDGKE